MQYRKIISGASEEEVWQQISADFAAEEDLLTYNVIIQQGNTSINLDIDIDPGGGFESGFESTTLISKVTGPQNFQFAIHHENFLDEIGKFFGMQDVTTGYEEFDNKVVVKTNDEAQVKVLFEDAGTRQLFQSLNDYTLGITKHETTKNAHQHFLEFIIDEGIVDTNQLQKIYHAFFNVLTLLNSSN